MHNAVIYVKYDNFHTNNTCLVPPSLVKSFADGDIGRIDVRVKETDELVAEYFGYGLRKFMAQALLGDTKEFDGNRYYLTPLIDPTA